MKTGKNTQVDRYNGKNRERFRVRNEKNIMKRPEQKTKTKQRQMKKY